MEVHPTPDQDAFIREAIEDGRLRRPEDAVEEALSLWEERERRRKEILLAIDASEASLARGEGRTVTSREDADRMAEDITRRGLVRLAADPDHPARSK
jgi:Arc/MetJ-type ribon-helix-helix transcriptional regulator